MGISGSKRVKTALYNLAEFDSACDSTYSHCLSLTQHAFSGVLPYQLLNAAAHIHQTLSSLRIPLILKWVPAPPSQSLVDSALRVITVTRRSDGTLVLGPDEFKEWAAEVFADSVVGNARKAVLSRIPIGIAGIAGIGAVTRSGKDLVGAAIGVYAVSVATSIYLSLSGGSVREKQIVRKELEKWPRIYVKSINFAVIFFLLLLVSMGKLPTPYTASVCGLTLSCCAAACTAKTPVGHRVIKGNNRLCCVY